MLSKEKIRLMTSLAIYQKSGGAEEWNIAQHYRFDYIQSQLFSAFVRYSICFMIAFGIYLLVDTGSFFESINTEGFLRTIKNYGLLYFAGLLVYLLIAIIVYTIRYNKALKNSAIYVTGLKRLNRKFHTKGTAEP